MIDKILLNDIFSGVATEGGGLRDKLSPMKIPSPFAPLSFENLVYAAHFPYSVQTMKSGVLVIFDKTIKKI